MSIKIIDLFHWQFHFRIYIIHFSCFNIAKQISVKEQNLSHLSVIMVVSYYLPRRTLYFAGRIIAADTAMHLRHQWSSSSSLLRPQSEPGAPPLAYGLSTRPIPLPNPQNRASLPSVSPKIPTPHFHQISLPSALSPTAKTILWNVMGWVRAMRNIPQPEIAWNGVQPTASSYQLELSTKTNPDPPPLNRPRPVSFARYMSPNPS